MPFIQICSLTIRTHVVASKTFFCCKDFAINAHIKARTQNDIICKAKKKFSNDFIVHESLVYGSIGFVAHILLKFKAKIFLEKLLELHMSCAPLIIQQEQELEKKLF